MPNCRCCKPALSFADYSGRIKHEKKTKGLTKSNLSKVGDSVNSKKRTADNRSTTSSADGKYYSCDEDKQSIDSRVSGASMRSDAKKAACFREMVNVFSAEKIQLSKSALKSNPFEDEISLILNRHLKDPLLVTSKQDMRKELELYPNMQAYLSNDNVVEKIKELLERKQEAIEEADKSYDNEIISLRKELTELLRQKEDLSANQLNLTKEKASFVKNLVAKDNEGLFVTKTETLEDDLKRLMEYELQLTHFKIDKIKSQLSHRVRLESKECYELIDKAVSPDLVSASASSQSSDLDWDIEVLKSVQRKPRVN